MFALGVVAAGVGAVGVGAGTYFAMTAYSRRNDRSELCDASNACTSPEGVRADADARDAARLSTITMLSGAALVAVGVTLVVVAPRARARTATSLAVHPEVAPGSGRIVLGGNF